MSTPTFVPSDAALLYSLPVNASRSVLELVPCNLCGHDDFSVVFNSPFRASDQERLADYIASTDRFDRYGQIVRCRSCGLIYTNPRPLPGTIIDSYARAADEDYAMESAGRSMNAHMCLHTVKKFVSAGRLLEVGCSTGYFLNAARLDFETHGVEPSRWAVAYARDKLRLDVKEGTLDTAEWPRDHFDAAVMIDVIEHFTDPRAALDKVWTLLKPSGILYVVTPDIESLSARILRGKWWGLRPAHIYYFSRRTLPAMLEKAGYEVVFQKSYGRIFTYTYWLSRLRNYPRLVRWPVERVIRGLGFEDKFLYLDTRDSMEICARRK
jgi:2-polyprenyl-3-methyl-5-hydroxy-6-metoxy-1,4-benzoquinol methylase